MKGIQQANHLLIFVLLFVGLAPSLFGQEPSKSHHHIVYFNVEDGLPSNEVYDLEADSSGQLWICTDNGIALFDGSTFEIHKPDGCSPIVLGVEKHYNNDLWFWTVRGEFLALSQTGLRQINNESFFEPYTSDKGVITQLLIGRNRSSYSAEGTNYWIDAPKEDKPFKHRLNPNDFVIMDNGDVSYAMKLATGQYFNFTYIKDGEIYKWHRVPITGSQINKPFRVVSNDRYIFIQTNTRIVRIDRSSKEFKMKHFAFRFTPSLEIINDSTIAIGTFGMGLHFLDYDLNLRFSMAQSMTVTSVFIDSEQNTWFGTLMNGVGLLMKGNMLVVDHPENYPKYMLTHNHEFHYLDNYGHYFKLYKDSGTIKGNRSQFENISFNRLGVEKNELVLYLSGKARVLSKSNTDIHIDPYLQQNNGRKIVFVNQKYKVYYPELSKFVSINLNPNITVMPRIRYEFVEDINHGYFGSFHSSFYLDKNSNLLSELRYNNPLDIRCIVPYQGNFIAGTKGDGILLINKDSVLESINLGVPVQSVLALFWMNDDLFIASPTTLYSIHKDKLGTGSGIINWNPILGIESLYLLNAGKWEDRVYLNTSESTYFFKPEEYKYNHHAPEILNLSVETVNGFVADCKEPIQLNKLKSKISIKPKTVHFSNRYKLNYRYRISGMDTTWSTTSTLPIVYNSLEAGDHTMEIFVQDRFGQWSEQAKRIQFHVSPPFWFAWWFISLVLLLFSSSGYLIYRYQVSQIRMKSKLEMSTFEAGNKALSLQLNPHFVFNSLNSVVSAISEGDSKMAIRFVSKLSRLMRGVFNRSQFQLVSIHEELEAVKQYLELESIRLNKSLNYTIKIDGELNTNRFAIPPLILQPIVENAIWHGVLRLETSLGLIEIEVIDDQEQIRIVIRDNGPSIEEKSAASQVKKNRISSLDLIQERLGLLKQLYSGTWNLEIVKREPQGSIVNILIPKLKFDPDENTNY